LCLLAYFLVADCGWLVAGGWWLVVGGWWRKWRIFVRPAGIF